MSAIKKLDEYIKERSSDDPLRHMAQLISWRIENKPYAQDIFVIDGYTDLTLLNKGYYLRFLNRGGLGYHLYGVEVASPGNVIIHENIPRNKLAESTDHPLKTQLINLNQAGKVYFRVANTQGGGVDLHESLVVHYADNGWVRTYVDQHVCRGDNLPRYLETPNGLGANSVFNINNKPGAQATSNAASITLTNNVTDRPVITSIGLSAGTPRNADQLQNNNQPLINSLTGYIKERQSEGDFHYNFIWIFSAIYWLTDMLLGTHYLIEKSKTVKINAAEKLKTYLSIDPTLDSKPNLTPAEIRSLNEGRLGEIVRQYGEITSDGTFEKIDHVPSNHQPDNPSI